jgi:hypothetical protein
VVRLLRADPALGLGATLGGYVTWSIALRGLDASRAMSYLYPGCCSAARS